MIISSRFLLAVAIIWIGLFDMPLGAATNFTMNWNLTGDGRGDTKGSLSFYDSQASKGTLYQYSCDITITRRHPGIPELHCEL
jgi:hypothetical protein